MKQNALEIPDRDSQKAGPGTMELWDASLAWIYKAEQSGGKRRRRRGGSFSSQFVPPELTHWGREGASHSSQNYTHHHSHLIPRNLHTPQTVTPAKATHTTTASYYYLGTYSHHRQSLQPKLHTPQTVIPTKATHTTANYSSQNYTHHRQSLQPKLHTPQLITPAKTTHTTDSHSIRTQSKQTSDGHVTVVDDRVAMRPLQP
ncbi:hypothetical protein Pcinc_034129 [Petrolisthes cinctipes]|uniref:Uncharacterized protein n=1 Tax=Petrolisthes cinctipes TaxID=88211 RepID=A0AAE1JXB5_PETCI|nr:hypothetical protein Pcinc_034129 [Petrolisthes cinctipes]